MGCVYPQHINLNLEGKSCVGLRCCGILSSPKNINFGGGLSNKVVLMGGGTHQLLGLINFGGKKKKFLHANKNIGLSI